MNSEEQFGGSENKFINENESVSNTIESDNEISDLSDTNIDLINQVDFRKKMRNQKIRTNKNKSN